MTRTKKVPGRNDPCSCNSGQKYKYCCIGMRPQERRVQLKNACDDCGEQHEIDLTTDVFNHFASTNLPLHNFCKDQDLFYFGHATVLEHLELMEALNAGTLTRERVIEVFRKNCTEEQVLSLIKEATRWSPYFARRHGLLKEAVEVHFLGKYGASIPALFAQIEGLLRDIGGLAPAEQVKPTIPREIWNARLMFTVDDDVRYFNAFITRLFSGNQTQDEFGRNSVLHGLNTEYQSEDASLILVLCVLKIGQFLWLQGHTHALIRGAED